MTDWKTRHDIDQIKWVADELERLFQSHGVSTFRDLLANYYDQSEVDEKASKLNKDLSALQLSLTGLNSALVDFNGELIDFDEDNTNLAEDLSKLKDNLMMFLDVLGLLDIDLTQLQSDLTDLGEQINGDGTSDGFIDVLQAIQYSIYGEPPYSQQDPSPSSLMGMLNAFGDELDSIVQGDDRLALSLSTLSGYLTTFKGSLSELQAQIISDYGQSIYDGLDEDLVKLIGAITKANEDLDDHMDLIDDVTDTIGSSSDVLADGTLYGVLNNTSTVASNASTKANSVESTITNTVTPTLNQVTQTDIPNVKNKMGYSAIPDNKTLQGQITANETEIGVVDGRVDDVNTAIGTVDVATDGNLQSQINTAGGRIDDVELGIGDTSDITGSIVDNIVSQSAVIGETTDVGADGTLFGLINKTIDDIDTTQSDITDIQDLQYGASDGGTTSNPTSDSVMGRIDTSEGLITTVQGDITDIQGDIGAVPTGSTLQGQLNSHDEQIGTVDVEINSDLQTQILNIVNMLKDMFVTVGQVDSISDVTDEEIVVTADDVVTTYYTVPDDYPYDIIHTNDTDEYFEKETVTIDNTEYTIWGWAVNPYAKQFQQTMLYDILTYLFTERSTPLDVLTKWEMESSDFDNTYIDDCQIVFYRQFNIVTCIYHIDTKTISNTTDKPVLPANKIPLAFRPPEIFYQTFTNYVSENPKHGILSVTSSGAMNIRMGASNSEMNIYGRLIYVVED